MAQILLLELVGRGPDKPDNVVVVGDDDQSILPLPGRQLRGVPPVRGPLREPPAWAPERGRGKVRRLPSWRIADRARTSSRQLTP